MEFESHLDVRAMIRLLRLKLRDINWKLGDSEYEGFYVLGRTEDGIRVKITEDPGPGWNAPPSYGSDVSRKYHLGVYFFQMEKGMSRSRRLTETETLQQKIMRAIS
jgi:hypothetical protein